MMETTSVPILSNFPILGYFNRFQQSRLVQGENTAGPKEVHNPTRHSVNVCKRIRQRVKDLV
jgi:hypothetical protein